MTDPRFPNGQPHHPHPHTSWLARAGKGLLTIAGTMTWAGAAVVITVGAFAVIGEIALPQDHKLRLANMIVSFQGDVAAGINDRTGEIDTKWEVIKTEELARIDRDSYEFNEAVTLRKEATLRKIDKADDLLGPRQLNNWIGEISCGITSWQAGDLARACDSGKAHRADVMAERETLIGDVQILRTDEQLAASMGISEEARKRFGLPVE